MAKFSREDIVAIRDGLQELTQAERAKLVEQLLGTRESEKPKPVEKVKRVVKSKRLTQKSNPRVRQ